MNIFIFIFLTYLAFGFRTNNCRRKMANKDLHLYIVKEYVMNFSSNLHFFFFLQRIPSGKKCMTKFDENAINFFTK